MRANSVFYYATVPLIAFYVLFVLVLYPAHGSLHPHGLYEKMAPLVPQGARSRHPAGQAGSWRQAASTGL